MKRPLVAALGATGLLIGVGGATSGATSGGPTPVPMPTDATGYAELAERGFSKALHHLYEATDANTSPGPWCELDDLYDATCHAQVDGVVVSLVGRVNDGYEVWLDGDEVVLSPTATIVPPPSGEDFGVDEYYDNFGNSPRYGSSSYGDIDCSTNHSSTSSNIHCSGGGEYLSINCRVNPATYRVTWTSHDSF